MKIKSFLASFLAVFMLSMSGAWADSVVNPIDQALENHGYLIKVSSCEGQCDALYSSCKANCQGVSDKGSGWISKSDRDRCESLCGDARYSCKKSCN